MPPSPPDDRERLEHMLEAAEDAIRFAQHRVRADLDSDKMLLRALSHCIEQVGEAAARTSMAGRSRSERIPWDQIVKMRNILVHVYWGIDRDRVWNTIRDDLPRLAMELRLVLANW